MSESLKITVEGEGELAQRLEEIAGKLQDLTRPMNEIGKYLTSFYSGEVFASRGGIIGEPWAPLSDAYAAEKAIEFPGRIPLIRTGLMNRGFKSKSGKLSTTIFNEADWFDFIQGGTDRMPARVMMKIDDTRSSQIVEIIEAEIARQAGI